VTVLVTGGAGFIGANFVLDWLAQGDEPLVNLDKLTYAGNRQTLAALEGDARHLFVHGDIGDAALVARLLATHSPRAIVNFAAESHVDRSIAGPGDFIQTNVVGTATLLQAARTYFDSLDLAARATFRFLHVSTDEVYGTLAPTDAPFSEAHGYAPNNPYAASKAASDHLVRAWHHTYGLPVLTTHCSNNYGPFQLPEKLIPLVIRNALAGQPLPVYGDGLQVRDWLHVSDHCSAIRRVLAAGAPGLLDELRPRADGRSYRAQVSHVAERPGHDRRYAIDAGKIARDLGWQPTYTLAAGLRHTVQWYLQHADWVEAVASGARRQGG